MIVSSILPIVVLVLVATSATAIVFTRDLFNQVIGLSFFGLLLSLMFLIVQAPDVALSQLVVGAVALPLMFLLALAKLRRGLIRREKP